MLLRILPLLLLFSNQFFPPPSKSIHLFCKKGRTISDEPYRCFARLRVVRFRFLRLLVMGRLLRSSGADCSSDRVNT